MIAAVVANAVELPRSSGVSAPGKDDVFGDVLARASWEIQDGAKPAPDGRPADGTSVEVDATDERDPQLADDANEASALANLIISQIAPPLTPTSGTADVQGMELPSVGGITRIGATSAVAAIADLPPGVTAAVDFTGDKVAGKFAVVADALPGISTAVSMLQPGLSSSPPSQSLTAPVERAPMCNALLLLGQEIVDLADGAEIKFGLRPAALGPVGITIGRADEGRTLNLGIETPQAVLAVQQAEALLNRANAGSPFVQVSVTLNTSTRERGSKLPQPQRVREWAHANAIKAPAPAAGRFA